MSTSACRQVARSQCIECPSGPGIHQSCRWIRTRSSTFLLAPSVQAARGCAAVLLPVQAACDDFLAASGLGPIKNLIDAVAATRPEQPHNGACLRSAARAGGGGRRQFEPRQAGYSNPFPSGESEPQGVEACRIGVP
jgi:hypothetical protein